MSRTKNRTRTRVLEEMNFPSEMSNMTVRIIEKEKGDLDGPVADIHRDHRVEITHGSHLGYTTSSFPLMHPDVAHFIAQAMTRTAHYIGEVGTGWAHTFKDPLTEINVVKVKGGLRLRKVYQEEMIVSEHETYIAFVGHEWIDDAGEIVKFERAWPLDHHTSEPRRGFGGYSAASAYDEDEIGLTVREANDRRFRAGAIGCIDVKPVRGEDKRVLPAGHGIRDDGKLVEPHQMVPKCLPPIPTRANLITAIRFADGVEFHKQESLQTVRRASRMDDDDFADLLAEARREPKPFRP